MRQATAGKDGGRPKGQQLKDRRLTLTTEDLAAALKEVCRSLAHLVYLQALTHSYSRAASSVS